MKINSAMTNIKLISREIKIFKSFCSIQITWLIKELAFIVILNIITLCPLLAQSISNIVLSNDGDKIAYLKNNDSLFFSDLSGKLNEIFVDDGLKDNGNQRLLKWTRDSQFLIY